MPAITNLCLQLGIPSDEAASRLCLPQRDLDGWNNGHAYVSPHELDKARQRLACGRITLHRANEVATRVTGVPLPADLIDVVRGTNEIWTRHRDRAEAYLRETGFDGTTISARSTLAHRLSFQLIQARIWHEAPGTRDNDTDLFVLRGHIIQTPDIAEGAQSG